MGNAIHGLMLGVMSVLMCACLDTPDTAHPKRFRGHGLSFLYPGDWRVVQDEVLANEPRAMHVVVQGKFGAQAVLHVYAKVEQKMTLEQWAKRWIRACEEDGHAHVLPTLYASLKSTIMGRKRQGMRRFMRVHDAHGTSMNYRQEFFDLGLVARGTMHVFLLTQATQDRWEKAQPGFEQMFASLREST